MTMHTIHLARDAAVHPRDEKGTTYFDSLRAVPDGPAKWALVWPPVWLAHHGLWTSLGVYLLVVAGFLALAVTPFAAIGVTLAFMPGLYLLLEGNQLRRAKLAMEGWDTLAVVDAPDEETALHRFLVQWSADHPDGPAALAATARVPDGRRRPDARPEGAFGVMGAA